MFVHLLTLLALSPTDTILRFPLASAAIGLESTGDRFSGIWAGVLPLTGPPDGPAQASGAPSHRAKWFAISAFGAGKDSLLYGVVVDSTAATLQVLVGQSAASGLRKAIALPLSRPRPDGEMTVSPRVEVGDGLARRGVRFALLANGRLEWRPDDRWETVLRLGNGTISVRIMPFAPGSWVTLMDQDNDGVHDKTLTPKLALPLGGYYWAWAVDADRREMVLTRTPRAPVITGFQAPVTSVTRDSGGPQIELLTPGEPTLLVFCYVGCPGCKLAMPIIDSLLSNATGPRRRRVVVVANAAADGRSYQSAFGSRMQVVLGASAWDAYAVLPTPTFVEVDARGKILWRDEGWSDEARRRVAGFLAARR